MESMSHASTVLRVGIATAIAGTLAAHGYKKKSLSVSGCAAAFIVGLGSMACSYRFGLLLLLFYYSSTKLTKYKQDVKDRLEEDFKSAGERDWKQVFASSILAIVVAVFYVFFFGDDRNVSFASYSSENIVTIAGISLPSHIWISQLQCMYVAHFATANGDTWASEVGMLAKTEPRLITSLFLRKVPAGTNGGMSPIGTLASAAGGAFIGLVYVVCSFAYPPAHSNGSSPQWIMILFGFLCGLIGSILDSLLGATLQVTFYSDERKMIIKNVESNLVREQEKKGQIRRICGLDILSNEAVNVLSIGMTMGLSWFLAPLLFRLCEHFSLTELPPLLND
jgi:uncharacterized membrane protein